MTLREQPKLIPQRTSLLMVWLGVVAFIWAAISLGVDVSEGPRSLPSWLVVVSYSFALPCFPAFVLAADELKRLLAHYEQYHSRGDIAWMAAMFFPFVQVPVVIAWFAFGRRARIRELQAAYERDHIAAFVS